MSLYLDYRIDTVCDDDAGRWRLVSITQVYDGRRLMSLRASHT
jgi:hypothetical protein